ncbi:Hpt domain-containing protein [Leptolyngbya sp. 7M]|uniref:Hpt domain-containing protein n=1 Tax=Leptolyngbya sp. 7M TaxID=2812896 RepID=UPI001B8C02F4|nr:Hpt domain-containing protein [Leptolyngbya sp. 7M]QYO63710.1 Hpt domain-containing protein [Leptolyngbya sp. 7M]
MIAETAATMSEAPISELMSAIERLQSTRSDEADSAIRDALDRIADVESFLVNSRRDLSELDVSSFIEASFSHLVADPTQPDETVSEETELDSDIAEIFIAEADDLLSAIEQNLALMSNGQYTDAELWNIRRAAHTFKGSAGMVGLADLSRTAHKIEDVIESLSETAEMERAGVILQLRSLVGELRASLPNTENTPKGDRQGEADHQPSPTALQNAEPPEVSADPIAIRPISENVQLESRDTVLRLSASRLKDLESEITSALVDSRRIADRFDDLFSQHKELLDAGYRLSNATERLRLAGLRLPDAIVPEVLENEAIPHDPTTSEQEDNVASFAECTYKLEETASDILMINAQASALLGTLKGVLDAREEQLELLRRKVSGLRIVDLGIIQNRLERAARVAAEETERIVELHFPDAQVSIDAQMLELLTEPLLHIVRNAVVHGIETPDERRFLGKSECGNITIRCRKTPISISIEIADDGAGISMAHLRQKAVESGKYEAAEAYNHKP